MKSINVIFKELESEMQCRTLLKKQQSRTEWLVYVISGWMDAAVRGLNLRCLRMQRGLQEARSPHKSGTTTVTWVGGFTCTFWACTMTFIVYVIVGFFFGGGGCFHVSKSVRFSFSNLHLTMPYKSQAKHKRWCHKSIKAGRLPGGDG